MRLVTEYYAKPGPIRAYDYITYDEDSYDVDCDGLGYFSRSIVGTGATAEESVADYKRQLEERDA